MRRWVCRCLVICDNFRAFRRHIPLSQSRPSECRCFKRNRPFFDYLSKLCSLIHFSPDGLSSLLFCETCSGRCCCGSSNCNLLAISKMPTRKKDTVARNEKSSVVSATRRQQYSTVPRKVEASTQKTLRGRRPKCGWQMMRWRWREVRGQSGK